MAWRPSSRPGSRAGGAAQHDAAAGSRAAPGEKPPGYSGAFEPGQMVATNWVNATIAQVSGDARYAVCRRG